MAKRRSAIVLFNLGGPDSLSAVKPFLFNLFNDPAIIAAPGPLRWAIATLISTTRNRSAQANYALMGGASPLLPETRLQADALAAVLRDRVGWADRDVRVFIAMRYWKPFVSDAAAAVRAWKADDVVLLPLYPQYSTTTTASSLAAWAQAYGDQGPQPRTICCYPAEAELAGAHAERILSAWRNAGAPENVRVLFSAHGLPKKTIDRGDPYQWQVEETAAAIATQLPSDWETEICYQSRVGPLEWIGPSTEESIAKAGADRKAVIVAPIAFVSEHIETLVELDREYAHKALEDGVSVYLRAPALGVHTRFIGLLADLVDRALAAPGGGLACPEQRLCPAACGACPRNAQTGAAPGRAAQALAAE